MQTLGLARLGARDASGEHSSGSDPGWMELEGMHCRPWHKVPMLEMALSSPMGAGSLFIISKLFIYFSALSDCFVGRDG